MSTSERSFPPRWVAKAIDGSFTTVRLAITTAILVGLAFAVQKIAYDQNTQAFIATSWNSFLHHQSFSIQATTLAAAALATLLLHTLISWWRHDPIYLIDFECYRPPENLFVTYDLFVTGSRDAAVFTPESLDFQTRILHKSGLSQETFFPPSLHEKPPRPDMRLAREEAKLVMFNAVQDLLHRTGLHPRDIDVLVVNCSLFNPTPSLSAMIINHFKMKSNIESYSLGGMGCSAGIIAVGLARKLLQSHPNRGYALVVSTENITQNWYKGNERSMLIPNTIFRMGSAAVLLSNKRTERRRALYELEHVVRVHLGADDKAYHCVYQHEDVDGVIGVELNRDLVKVAAKAMEVNLTRLGPLVLPWGEKLAFAANWVARKVLHARVLPYVPDFRRAFNHFCLHVGGRGVVEGLSKQLGLNDHQMSPSANTLYWYGNTSSSTVWYSFGYVESVQGVGVGERVWQIGFGSGFKCNSAVWRALRPVKRWHGAWEQLRGTGREEEAMNKLREIQAQGANEKVNTTTGTTANGSGENGKANGHHANGDGHGVENGGVRTRARAAGGLKN